MPTEPTPRVAAVAKILVELDLDQLGCAGPKDFYPVQAARIVAALDAYDAEHAVEGQVQVGYWFTGTDEELGSDNPYERFAWIGDVTDENPLNPEFKAKCVPLFRVRVRPETGAEQ